MERVWRPDDLRVCLVLEHDPDDVLVGRRRSDDRAAGMRWAGWAGDSRRRQRAHRRTVTGRIEAAQPSV